MRRSELAADIAEIEQEVTNARAWILSAETKLATLRAKLSAPPAEQPYDPAQALARSYDGDGGGTPASEMGDKPSVQFSGDPLAVSLASAVTPKQIGMIRALAREVGVDYELECQEQLGCRPEELGKRAASAFIDYLKVIQ